MSVSVAPLREHLLDAGVGGIVNALLLAPQMAALLGTRMLLPHCLLTCQQPLTILLHVHLSIECVRESMCLCMCAECGYLLIELKKTGGLQGLVSLCEGSGRAAELLLADTRQAEALVARLDVLVRNPQAHIRLLAAWAVALLARSTRFGAARRPLASQALHVLVKLVRAAESAVAEVAPHVIGTYAASAPPLSSIPSYQLEPMFK